MSGMDHIDDPIASDEPVANTYFASIASSSNNRHIARGPVTPPDPGVGASTSAADDINDPAAMVESAESPPMLPTTSAAAVEMPAAAFVVVESVSTSVQLPSNGENETQFLLNVTTNVEPVDPEPTSIADAQRVQADSKMHVDQQTTQPPAVSDGELSSVADESSVVINNEKEPREPTDSASGDRTARMSKSKRKRIKRERGKAAAAIDNVGASYAGEDDASSSRKRKQPGGEDKAKTKEMKMGDTRTSGQETRRMNYRDAASSNSPSSTMAVRGATEREAAESKTTLITSNGAPTLNGTSSKAYDKKDTMLSKDTAPSIQSPDPSFFTDVDDENSSPIMRTFRALQSLSLPAALDAVFSIHPQDIAMIDKHEMVEVLDCMYALNRRREQLTINRVQLTEEVRSICTTELTLLNDLEHVMNEEERAHLQHLRQCAPSMDELAPFNAHFDHRDASLATGTLRLHAVDLVPPPETPYVGQPDAAWELLLRYIPYSMRGAPPPPAPHQQATFVHEAPPPAAMIQAQPPQHLTLIHEAPPPTTILQQPPPHMTIVHEPPPPASSMLQPSQHATFVHEAPSASMLTPQQQHMTIVHEPPTTTMMQPQPPPPHITFVHDAPPPTIMMPPPPQQQPMPILQQQQQQAPTQEPPLSPVSAFRNTLKTLVGSPSVFRSLLGGADSSASQVSSNVAVAGSPQVASSVAATAGSPPPPSSNSDAPPIESVGPSVIVACPIADANNDAHAIEETPFVIAADADQLAAMETPPHVDEDENNTTSPPPPEAVAPTVDP